VRRGFEENCLHCVHAVLSSLSIPKRGSGQQAQSGSRHEEVPACCPDQQNSADLWDNWRRLPHPDDLVDAWSSFYDLKRVGNAPAG
jgi:hypothetical protein